MVKESSPESNCSWSPLAGLWPFSGERFWVSCMVVMKDPLVSMVQRKSPSLPNSSCSREFLEHKLNKKETMGDFFCLHQLSAFPKEFQVILCNLQSCFLIQDEAIVEWGATAEDTSLSGNNHCNNRDDSVVISNIHNIQHKGFTSPSSVQLPVLPTER